MVKAVHPFERLSELVGVRSKLEVGVRANEGITASLPHQRAGFVSTRDESTDEQWANFIQSNVGHVKTHPSFPGKTTEHQDILPSSLLSDHCARRL